MVQFDPQFLKSDYIATVISDMGYTAIVQDDLRFSSSIPFPSAPFPTATMQVDGMVCINCSQIIESNLKKMKGVKHISVSIEEKLAQISYDPDIISVHEICSAIEDLGFEATLPSSDPSMDLMLAGPPPSSCNQNSCVMTIDGMTCSSCVALIESKLCGMEAVMSVEVLLQEKEGRITYNAAATSPKDLLCVIEDLGYTVTHINGM